MTLHFHLAYVDTHCHLNFDAFNDDRRLVIEHAQINGIEKILNPGVDVETSRAALKCSRDFPQVFAAVGVHPNDLVWTDTTLIELRELAADDKVVAVGEIGLDYYRNYSSKEQQKAVLEKQLDLAAELGLPVIIHNRDSHADILDILIEWHQGLRSSGSKLADRPGVLHSFSGGLEFATEIVALNFKLGISGMVTYKNSNELQSVVRSLPLESLLIETDAPFQSPLPFRGKRNEPTNVRIVAGKIAELRACPVEQVVKVTTQEADILFRWRLMH